ncbi:MAG: hypothetical protein FJ313_08810, partial [Gemmatimonadetes bacterium]|nr:hypothetical protein [Gemmatimonadota bacterium]
MRKALICTAVLLMTALVVSAAFALPANNGVRPQKELLPADLNRVPVAGVSKTAQADTFWFGGTVWDNGQTRWEAAMSQNVSIDGWTFDTETPTYLQGWTARDLTAITPPTLPPGNADNSDWRWVDAAKYALYGTPGTDLFPGTQTPL